MSFASSGYLELGMFNECPSGQRYPWVALDQLMTSAGATEDRYFLLGSSAGFTYVVALGPAPVIYTVTGSLLVIPKWVAPGGSV